MSKDDELIERIKNGGDILQSDIRSTENLSSVLEGCDSLYFELSEQNKKNGK